MSNFFNKVFRVSDDGFGWVDGECFYIPENVKMTVERPFTLVQPPNQNWKPYFDWESETWIETASPEERDTGEDLNDQQTVIERRAELLDQLLEEPKKE